MVMVLFGIGWRIAGYCREPVLTALPLLAPGALVLVPAMPARLRPGSRAENIDSLTPKGAPS